MARNEFAKAAGLYLEESKAAGPEGQRTHEAMVRALLRSGKLDDANLAATSWLKSEPQSGWAQVAMGEVQWRKGDFVSAVTTLNKASNTDGCIAELHAAFAEIQRLSGLFASAAHQLAFAREIDPIDTEIESAWSQLQPRSAQLKEVTDSLEHSAFLSDKEREALENRKQALSQPIVESCRLTSPATATSIPYRAIRNSPESPILWGLEVTFDGKQRRLEIDTGATGLLLTKAAAASLHLEPNTRLKVGGIGDEGSVDSYIANVKSIRIGELVFENCDVTVLGTDPKGMEGQDGLIGGDVFESFVLTLDFPGHTLKLDPLPNIPDSAVTTLALQTGVQTDLPVRDRYIAPEMASWTKVFRSGHDILLPAHLNGGPAHLFIMDTGSQLNLISPQAALEVGKVSKYSATEIYGIAGKVNKTYTTAPLTISFANIRQPSYGMTATDTSMLGREIGVDVAGFIGAESLHRLKVSIDYRDDLVDFSFDPKRLTHCVDGVAIDNCY